MLAIERDWTRDQELRFIRSEDAHRRRTEQEIRQVLRGQRSHVEVLHLGAIMRLSMFELVRLIDDCADDPDDLTERDTNIKWIAEQTGNELAKREL